jgi:EAL domain-containing protein (putative c-di-GMP-specific phosphodiesterase class I)
MLEVGETTLSENPDEALVILQRIVDLGFRVAVDNFGAGQAPLNHLVQLPIEVVKLDPKLTAASTVAGRQLAMVHAMMQLSHTLGVQVMAQSIETREQFEALRRMGCELGQGNYLAKPVEPTQAYAGRESWTQMPGQ